MTWFRKTREFTPSIGVSASAVELARAMGSCPGCTNNLSGHRFVQLASWPIRTDNKPEIQEFFKKVKAHDWQAVSQYQKFEGALDALMAYVISCPEKGTVVVFTNDPTELYAGERMVGYE